MAIVDLSLPLEDDRQWAPWWNRTKVTRQGHSFGALVIRWLFGVNRALLPSGLGWANDHISLSTHGTTHLDAPWHYGPRCAGQPARTIDEIPLEWCCGPGVVLDLTHLDREAAASIADLEAALDRIGHVLQPNEIVLVRTDNDQLWGTRDYYDAGPGISAEATRWLIDRGIRLTGIDAWGWDRPLKVQAREARKTRRADVFWAAHYVGTEAEYCHLERLANLQALPSTGFTVCAFPLKVKHGSAGPARVVAILNRDSGPPTVSREPPASVNDRARN